MRKREEQLMRSQWTIRTRRLQEERVQWRARDDIVKKYHNLLSSSSTCPAAVPGYGLCHRELPRRAWGPPGRELLPARKVLPALKKWLRPSSHIFIPCSFFNDLQLEQPCFSKTSFLQEHVHIQGQPCTHSCGNILENRCCQVIQGISEVCF